jgi:predicted membrane-bound dolichyl-phosphate-mannose-protein mannosyltransferase
MIFKSFFLAHTGGAQYRQKLFAEKFWLNWAILVILALSAIRGQKFNFSFKNKKKRAGV